MNTRKKLTLAQLGFLAMTFTLSAPVEASNPFAGAKIYTRHCQVCHGPKGRGVLATTPDFSWQGGPNNGLRKTDPELAARILQGKHACPAFQGILAIGDIMNVIAHLRSLH